jgi:hypothetical protein
MTVRTEWHREYYKKNAAKRRLDRRASYARHKAKEQAAQKLRRQENPEKHRARLRVQYAVEHGQLKRLPCKICGSRKSHAHHRDYATPLDVTWLCAAHHAEHHRGLN